MENKFFSLTVEEANKALDDFKLYHDYESIIQLMESNKEMLETGGFKVNDIISYCKQIIELHNKI